MTDKIDPTPGGDGQAFMVAQAIRQHGSVGDGWIAESDTAYAAGHENSDIDGAPLNAFAGVSDSGLDATFDTGEAFIGGSWVARDTQTTVTLADDTADQTVYVGWDYNETDTVKLGLESDFESLDPRVPLYTFETAGGDIISSDDERQLGKGDTFGAAEFGADSELARFLMTAISDEPNGTPGASSNELFRAVGQSSDLVLSADAGGAMNLAWNTYYDGSTWRYIDGGEDAYRIAFRLGRIELYVAHGIGTSDDEAVDFERLIFDGDGDILAPSGQVIFDSANDHVPQDRLAGPSSELSGYPLPAGDIDDGETSGLDADTLDGQHASEIAAAGEWTVIETHKQTNPSVHTDFDTGTLSETFDAYEVELHIAATDGDDPTFFNCRVNNDARSVYEWVGLSRDGHFSRQHEQQWQNLAATRDDERGWAVATLSADILGVNTPESTASIAARSSGSYIPRHLTHGSLDIADFDTINRMRFWTNAPAAGMIQIKGKNY